MNQLKRWLAVVWLGGMIGAGRLWADGVPADGILQDIETGAAQEIAGSGLSKHGSQKSIKIKTGTAKLSKTKKSKKTGPKKTKKSGSKKTKSGKSRKKKSKKTA